jgi:DNA polymerase (family 10)
MPSNAEAAEQLRAIADLLDLLGERFKPEAYRRAARSIEGLGEELELVARRGALDTIPGVGAAISEKLREYLQSGSIPYLDRLRSEIPPGIVEILRYDGVGPKTTRRFWVELGVNGPSELRAALEAGRLDGVKGFGPKKIAQLKATLEAKAPTGARTPLWEATVVARGLMEGLRSTAPVERIEAAGSLRRGRESVGDLDLLVTSPRAPEVFEAFTRLPDVASVRLRGETKETVVLRSGLQVDLRVVPPASFGAALQYFTGSKDHNVRLRSRARELGLKVNEYGVYRGEEVVAGVDEAGVYRALGLPEIPPELREDRGEIDEAERGQLPKLVTAPDLRGDLHVHLGAGGSAASVRGAIERARSLGHAFLGLLVEDESLREEVLSLRTAAAAGPKVLLGIERPLAKAFEPLPEGTDFGLAVPGPDDGPRSPTSTPSHGAPLALVHLATNGPGSAEGVASLASPWISWASEAGVALELTALGSRDGIDSASARTARGRGVRFLVSGGGDAGPDPLRLSVALTLARRAGFDVEGIVNASTDPLAATAPRRAPRGRRRGAGDAGGGSAAPRNDRGR